MTNEPKRRQRTFITDPCPICVRWHCLDCLAPRAAVADGRMSPQPKACHVCRSVHGEYRPVHHYDRAVHDAHAARFTLEERVFPHDPELIRDLFALVDFLEPHLKVFRQNRRRALVTRREYPENNAAVNLGSEVLLRIENIVRHWVKNHPEESYRRIR